MFDRILLAVGGQDATEPARVAARLCQALGGRLTIVSVYRPTSTAFGEPDYSEHLIPRLARAEEALAQASVIAVSEGLASPPELEALEGDPVERIVGLARQRPFDLIVLGTRRRGRLGTALLGSVSHGVAARAGVPVLVVPEPATAEGGRR